MSFTIATKRGVAQHYGARSVGRAAGIVKTEGAKNELVIHLTGQMLSDKIVLPLYVPAGASFTGVAKLIVDEVFVLAASSVVEVGEEALEATNGISLTEANLESTGVKDVSAGLAGEWAANAQVPHSQRVDIAFSAGSVTTASAGKATLILEYIKL